ncbi:dolichol-phosphate mannosyltransferase subunit 3 [Nematostella vectensis]|uniref:dolichol-phosphate mannosyltransferase subunit 3 n=1 Tax=Nematostella vectensis TaxID=45351 RepID=UPI00138FE228|nr:dolichol-phosphate mannosyltransferase subunit 3 [Nematostella vectensis]
MTKLLQWLSFGGLAFTLWISLLLGFPLKLSHQMREVVLPLPVYAVIVFGCYSLAVVGYRVATFNDCVEASDSLQKEILEAREDLESKGFKFD